MLHKIFFICCLYASLCFGQTSWTKYQNNPVMVKDTTLMGTWEWAAIGQPFCLFEEDTFKMWYAAGGIASIGDTIVRGRICYAHSVDGTTWVKRDSLVPVLDVGLPGTWDSRWCDTPAVLNDGTEYLLYYYGDSTSVVFSALGVATSPDGISWIRDANNPILERGEVLEWDGFWLESPAVLYDSATSVYSMWYTGVGYGPGLPSDLWIQIGYAYSFDGLTWSKDTVNNPVLETGSPGLWDDGWVSVPAVRKSNGIYEMWYIGASSADWQADSTLDTARVGYATSPDGISWTKYPGNPILTNYDPPVDTGGPWAPDVLFDGVGFRMWYETANGISYATAPLTAIEEEDNWESGTRKWELICSPNPFATFTTIHLAGIGQRAECIELQIYDVSGRRVRDFILYPSSFIFPAKLEWDGRDEYGRELPSGLYFLRVVAGNYTTTRKLMMVR